MPERRLEWWPVAAWELRRMIQRKDFVVSALLVPLLAIGSGLLVAWMRDRSENETIRVAVVREAGAPSPPRVGQFVFVEPPAEARGRDALVRGVRAKTWDAALVLPADWIAGGRPELVVRTQSPGWKRRLADSLGAFARRERAAAEGIGPERLARVDAPVAFEERLADPERRRSRGDRIVALTLMMLLTVSLFTAVSYMIVGISGEKQARVTEVVVSAIRARSWMDGKIVAYTLIGLLLAALWGGTALVAAVMFRVPLPDAVSPGIVLLQLVFAVVGFAFYAAFFAALMATMKDIQSASKLQGNFFMIPFIPLALLGPLVNNPEAPWVIALAMVPFFSPTMWPMLLGLGAPSAWQTALALALLAVAAWLMRRFAGYAFRIGMLMYGKDVSLPELMRWSKSA